MPTRMAVVYVELDVPLCSLTYGVAPCTASLTSSPPTGTIKCFNSLGTCQDRPNFTTTAVPYRFAEDVGILPREIEAFPFITKIDYTPAIVSLGGDLGQRATLKIEFKNAQHSDAGDLFDKYPADRDYDDPWSRGTFWGKFRARNPFLRGRNCRLIRGLVPDEIAANHDHGTPLPSGVLDEQETRHFIIESINGPSADGKFEIIAKDVLTLAAGDRAVVPELSNGFLVSPITNSDLSATLSPTGIGSEYPASGFATIGGNEGVSYTRSGDVLTLTRGQLNAAAVAHVAGERVQVVKVYAGDDGADILYDLWVLAGADLDWLPLSDWQNETAAFLGTVYTLVIAEPTPINKVVEEMLLYMGAAQWWDDLNQVIRLRILRAVATDADRFDEDNVMAGSLDVTEQPTKRVSRVIVYFAQFNLLKKIDELDNYRSTETVIDTQSEDDEGSAIKIILARGIAAGGRSVATTLGQKYLSRYVRPPRRFNFDLMQYSRTTPLLGSGYRLGGGDPLIASWPFEDETGDRIDVPIQITRVDPSGKIEAEEMLFTAQGDDVDPTDRTIILEANENNVNLRTRHDLLYPAPVSGDTVTVYINSGVIIGSNSTASPAIHVGTWPAGVTITLNVSGRIEGCGGRGGNGQPLGTGTSPEAGSVGGPALYTRQAITYTDTSGQVWGGGGGGGGGGIFFSSFAGCGGGGGAGQFPGAGGGSGGESAPGGSAGTTEAGGAGGSNTVSDGGAGGGPGLAGAAGSSSGAAGGLAGASIDGISFVTTVGAAGDRRGGQIN